MAEVIGIDEFAHAITGLVDEATGNVKKGANKAIREGGMAARDEWQSLAASMFDSPDGMYAASIQCTVHRGDKGPTAEVGSKTLPGLPHLLEKGHALVGGGMSRAFPHVAPAAEVGFEKTEKLIDEIRL